MAQSSPHGPSELFMDEQGRPSQRGTETAPSPRCWNDRLQLAEGETAAGAPPEAEPEREGLGMQAPAAPLLTMTEVPNL